METVRFLINGVVIYFEGDLENNIALLSDDDFTYDYITRAIRSNALIDYNFDETTNIADLRIVRSKDQPHAPSALKCVNNKKTNLDVATDVWMPNSKPSEMDNKATLLLLEMRGSEIYKKKFDDKKSAKNILWREIAQALNKAGYNVGEGRQGAEKCRQKWANLQKSYMSFITHVNSTGSSFKSEPPFYTEMDKILRDKDKVQPTHLKDSMLLSSAPITIEIENHPFSSVSSLIETEHIMSDSQQPSTILECSSQPEASNTPSSSATPQPEASNIPSSSATPQPEASNTPSSSATPQKRKRANSTKTEMIQLIETIRDDQKSFQNEMLTAFKNSNKKQEEQRDTLINILSKLIKSPKKKNRKRKHSSSNSESSE